MGKEITVKINIETDYDEEEVAIVAPYYFVTYVDDWNKVHMAMIKDLVYLQFIQDRFYVKECRFIEK